MKHIMTKNVKGNKHPRTYNINEEPSKYENNKSSDNTETHLRSSPFGDKSYYSARFSACVSTFSLSSLLDRASLLLRS